MLDLDKLFDFFLGRVQTMTKLVGQVCICLFIACAEVVVRKNLLSQPMLGLIQSAYRGTITKNSKGKKVIGAPKLVAQELPANCCVHIHVVVLDRLGTRTFSATCANPVLAVDPHSDNLLGEVPAKFVSVSEKPDRCIIKVGEASVKAMHALKDVKPIMPSSVAWWSLMQVGRWGGWGLGFQCCWVMLNWFHGALPFFLDFPGHQNNMFHTFLLFASVVICHDQSWDT